MAGLPAGRVLGGDTDTIAAMAGAVGGACHGAEAFPAGAVASVIEVNGLALEPLAPGCSSCGTPDERTPPGHGRRHPRATSSVRPALPQRGGDVLAREALLTTGGGFNVLPPRPAGPPGAYVGAHGTGRFGDLVRADLAAEGIALGQPPVARGCDSGFSCRLVDDAAERTFVTWFGVEGRMLPRPLAELALEPDDVVHLSGYDLAYAHGPLVGPWFSRLPDRHTAFFDPGPVVADIATGLLHGALDRADWVSLNRDEARTLTGADDAADAARAWAASLPLPRRGVVVRDGAAGLLAARRARPDDVRHVPAPLPPFRPTDTSGAGDCHVGTFVAAVTRGDDPVTAARWANASAAICTQRVGPATGPTYAEVAVALAAVG